MNSWRGWLLRRRRSLAAWGRPAFWYYQDAGIYISPLEILNSGKATIIGILWQDEYINGTVYLVKYKYFDAVNYVAVAV